MGTAASGWSSPGVLREDTAAICKACPAEIEIFGHGALCMCYSGQCEMSALIGGRSGNRGTCAQPCRLPYGFNGPAKNTYPLSLKDSCLADRISDMERMDVSCLKLEGRMKRPEYVAVITDIYARLIREAASPPPPKKGSGAGLLPLRLYSGLLAGSPRPRHVRHPP